MHTLSMDFLAIDTRTQFKFNVLMKVDEFSKYGFVIQVKSENVKNITEILYRSIYTKFGISEVIYSDWGQTFISNVLKQVNELLSIKHTVTTPYTPQSNCNCVRLNSPILSRFRTLPPNEKSRWHLRLDSLMLAYNSIVHDSTQTSPFYIMFWRKPRFPMDLMIRLRRFTEKRPIGVRILQPNASKNWKHRLSYVPKILINGNNVVSEILIAS